MTASVNILRGDLHLAVSTAFNRGRYVLMTGGGDGQPIEITIDLRERPDDLFDADYDKRVDADQRRREAEIMSRPENIGRWFPFNVEPPASLKPPPERHHPDVEPAVYEAMRQIKGERRRASLVGQALGLDAHETGAAAGANVLDWFTAKMENLSESAYTTDDHGPAIPAQGELRRSAEVVGEENGWAVREPGPSVYEFAVGDSPPAV